MIVSHARLAKGAARLLVRQNALQPGHVLGQRLDIGLRGIDHRQPLLQPPQVFMRRLRLLGNRGAQPVRHAVDPLADRLVEFGLPRPEHIGHRGDAALHLGLRGKQRRHALRGIICRLPVAPPAKNRRNAGKQHDCGSAEQAHAQRHRVGAKDEKRLIERQKCRFHRKRVRGFGFAD